MRTGFESRACYQRTFMVTITYRDGDEQVIDGNALVMRELNTSGTVSEYIVTLGPLEIRCPASAVRCVRSLRESREGEG